MNGAGKEQGTHGDPARTVRLDLPLLIPGVAEEQDACVVRIESMLVARPGIEKAHVVRDDRGELQLCVHYDPEIVPLSRVTDLAHSLGADIAGRYGHEVFTVRGIQNQRRADAIAALLMREPGILAAGVNPIAELVRIEYDHSLTDRDRVEMAVGRITNDPKSGPGDAIAVPAPAGARSDTSVAPADVRDRSSSPEEEEDHSGHDHAAGEHPAGDHAGHDHGSGWFGQYGEMAFAIGCGVFLLIGWLLERDADGALLRYLPFLLAAYFLGGFFTTRDAWESIRTGKFEIDTLMIVAAAGAAALGEWTEGALLLFLFSLGHSLEHYAMGRARKAIEALAKLAPRTAVVRRDGKEIEVPTETLRIDDIVIVRPGERIPADGEVVQGSSSVDQAPITGESMPVTKGVGKDLDSRVFTGTINGEGTLEVAVRKLAGESTLARVVKMVREAETQKSPTQKLTDRIERYFVPSILVLVALLIVVPPFIFDEAFAVSFYRAMSVLVAASPCALAIATPSAVLSGVARAARGGVLIKGGVHLENLGAVTAVLMDKTGTLTEGKPKVTDILPAEGADEAGLLRVAAAVERKSTHPLALAIVRAAEERGAGEGSAAGDLQNITGQGVLSSVDGQTVAIGNLALFKSQPGTAPPPAVIESLERLQAQGRTTMIIRHGDRYLGVVGLMDTPRESAREVIATLHELGVTRLIMLSGDHQLVASAVAKELGLDDARGDLMPEDKVEVVRELAATTKVAMIGDGVNDAPALAHATVGIAMGTTGSDVALETADVALMADDLSKLPFAIGLSRKAASIIKQNLVISLGMVAFLIPATLFGFAGIGIAVLLHEGSTIVVVVNALRLLAYSDGTARK